MDLIMRIRRLSLTKKCLLLIFFVVIFISCFGYFNNYAYYQLLHLQWDCFAPEKLKDDIAYIIHHFDQVAAQVNFTYWLGSGSLIGAYRYKDVLAWDYDGDLAFLYRDRDMMVKVLPDLLSKHQITVHRKEDDINKKFKPYWEMRYGDAYVDLVPHDEYRFVKNLHKNYWSYYRDDTVVRVYEPTDIYYKIFSCYQNQNSDIFPLRRCEFRKKFANCPNNPMQVIKDMYCYSSKTGISVPYKLDCWAPSKLFKIWGWIN